MNRRYFIKLGTFGSLLSIAELTACSTNKHPMLDTEVLIAGGTQGSIMAAIAAARAGVKVALVEYHHHIGGLSTSGLGKSDIENRDAIAGLFEEFTKRVLNWYVNKYGADSENVRKCREGYYYEPYVAEEVFNDMIAEEPHITLLAGFQIEQSVANSGNVSEVIFRNRETGENQTWKAKAFVD